MAHQVQQVLVEGLGAVGVSARLDEIKSDVAADFPLSETEVTAFCENLATEILKIHDIELEAVTALQEAMA